MKVNNPLKYSSRKNLEQLFYMRFDRGDFYKLLYEHNKKYNDSAHIVYDVNTFLEKLIYE